MKKLLFIIPKVFPVILFLVIISLDTFADTHRYGCWIPGTNFIWHTNDPANPGLTNFLNDGVSAALNGDDDGYYHKDLRCGDSLKPCTVYWQVSSYHPAGEIRGTGYLADYSIEHCPIDDYIPAVLTLIAAFGFLQIRKIPIFNSVNENNHHHRSL